MNKIMFIFIFVSSLYATNGTLDSYTVDDVKVLRLTSHNKSSCVVTYSTSSNYSFDLTSCLHYKNKNDELVLCTLDNKLCKTYDELNFFNVSGKILLEEKQSKQPTFIGTKYFNFDSGSGTGYILKILKNKKVILSDDTRFGIKEIYSGSYKGLLDLGYKVYDDVICYKEQKYELMCSKLYE